MDGLGLGAQVVAVVSGWVLENQESILRVATLPSLLWHGTSSIENELNRSVKRHWKKLEFIDLWDCSLLGAAQASTRLMTRQLEICQFHFDIFWLNLSANSANRIQSTLWRCINDDAEYFSSIRIQLKRNSSKRRRGRETERARKDTRKGQLKRGFDLEK